MKIAGFKLPGKRDVSFTLDPKTALQIWFHLHASMHCEETTRASRILVAAFLPQLGRAIVDTGFIRRELLDEMAVHMQSKPAPRPIDDAVQALKDS